MNNVRYASGFAGANAGAKIQAAIDDLPSTGGWVIADFEGNQTISSTVTIDKPVRLMLGNATFTGSVAPLFSLTTQGAELAGTTNDTWNGVGAKLVFTGTGNVITLGVPNVIISAGHTIENIAVDETGATAPSPLTVQTASWAANTVTVKTTTPHALSLGDTVNVSGISPAGYNGIRVVKSVSDNTHFTTSLTSNPGTYSSGGTVQRYVAAIYTYGAAMDTFRRLVFTNIPANQYSILITAGVGAGWNTIGGQHNVIEKIRSFSDGGGKLRMQGDVTLTPPQRITTSYINTTDFWAYEFDQVGGLTLVNATWEGTVSPGYDFNDVTSVTMIGCDIEGTGTTAIKLTDVNNFNTIGIHYTNFTGTEKISGVPTSAGFSTALGLDTQFWGSTTLSNAPFGVGTGVGADGDPKIPAARMEVVSSGAASDVVKFRSSASDGTNTNGSVIFRDSGAPATIFLRMYNNAGTETVRIEPGGDSYLQGGNLGVGKVPGANAQLDVAKSIVSGVNTVTFSATPTFDASLGNTQKITLTGNVTSSTLSNGVAGQFLYFDICQDLTGGHPFTWPANVKTGAAISPRASTCTHQAFIFDGTNALAVSLGVDDVGTAWLPVHADVNGTNKLMTTHHLLIDSGADDYELVSNSLHDIQRSADSSKSSWDVCIGCGADEVSLWRAAPTAGALAWVKKWSLNSSGIAAGTAAAEVIKTVTFSATPTFDVSLGGIQKITLTGNVTSSTLSNAPTGGSIKFLICQDATGSRTFVWPTNVKGGMTIGSSASTCSAQSFIFDGTNAYGLGPGATNM